MQDVSHYLTIGKTIVSYGNEHDIGAFWIKHYHAKPSTSMPTYQECSAHALVLLLAIIHMTICMADQQRMLISQEMNSLHGGGKGGVTAGKLVSENSWCYRVNMARNFQITVSY